MALIMAQYKEYFYWWRLNRAHFENGEVSYFDPIERTCLRINPTKGDVPSERWIQLPIIREIDVFKNFLRLSGRISLLEKYSHLNDYDFSVKIDELAERYQFDERLDGYRQCYLGEIMSDWICKNHIPNCKMYSEAPLLVVNTEEDMQEYIAQIREMYLSENKQEATFKKSLR